MICAVFFILINYLQGFSMYNIFIPKRIAFIIVFISSLFLIVSFDTTETNNGTVSLSFSSGSSSPKVTADILTLETVKILLREVKIKRQSGNDSLDIKVGPFVVYLNFDGMTTDFAVSDIPPGICQWTGKQFRSRAYVYYPATGVRSDDGWIHFRLDFLHPGDFCRDYFQYFPH